MVFAVYPNNTGGNFFINCLSLSTQAPLRDAQLARDHLTQPWNADQKLRYFQTQLSEARRTRVWRDLNLGCSQLFGISSLEWLTLFPEIISAQMDTVIARLIESKQYLFLVNHWSMETLPRMLDLWPQARIILFENYRSFLNQRGKSNNHNNLIQYWQKVRGQDWPEHPPQNQNEFANLDPRLQYELIQDFDYEISRYFDNQMLFDKKWHEHANAICEDNSSIFRVNIDDAYSSAEKVILYVENCASWLGINEVYPDHIKIYYDDWINTINVINQHVSPA